MKLNRGLFQWMPKTPEAVDVCFVLDEVVASEDGSTKTIQRERTVRDIDTSTKYHRLKDMACFHMNVRGPVELWIVGDDACPKAICLDDGRPISGVIYDDCTIQIEKTGFLEGKTTAQIDVPATIPVAETNGWPGSVELASVDSQGCSSRNLQRQPPDQINSAKMHFHDHNLESNGIAAEIDCAGKLVVQGHCSQFSFDGGQSACTSICLYAAAQLLPVIDEVPKCLDSDLIDSFVQLGTVLHGGIDLGNNEHTSVDDLWEQNTFQDTIRCVSRGEAFYGITSKIFFRNCLMNATVFAISQDCIAVAVLITKPPETILVLCKDAQRRAEWFIFDSHGQQSETEKKAYVRYFDTLESVSNGLLGKFPPIPGLEEDEVLQAQQVNMFEAHPLIVRQFKKQELRIDLETYVPHCSWEKPAQDSTIAQPLELSRSICYRKHSDDQTQPQQEFSTDLLRDKITGELFVDPVFCDKGHTHERSCIELHFKSRREMQAAEERENLDQPQDDACNRGSNYEPTCPFSGEAISEILIENDQCRHLVAMLVESSVISLCQEELQDWKSRQKEAKRAAQERSAAASREGLNGRVSPQIQQQESEAQTLPTVNAETVRDHRASSAQTTSRVPSDLQLSVALCPRYCREPTMSSQSQQERCSNPCCRSLLETSSLRSCERCAQLNCSECIIFYVKDATSAQAEQDKDLHSICPDCVCQIREVISSNDTGLINDLDSIMKVFLQSLLERKAQIQHQLLHYNRHSEFAKVSRRLKNEIRRLNQDVEEVQQQIRNAKQKAETVQMDRKEQVRENLDREGHLRDDAPNSKQIELQEKIAELQSQFNEIDWSKETDVIRGSQIQYDLDNATTELAVVRSMASCCERNEAALLAECAAVKREHEALAKKGPDNDQDYDYAIRLSELMFTHEKLSSDLIRLRAEQKQEIGTSDVCRTSPDTTKKDKVCFGKIVSNLFSRVVTPIATGSQDEDKSSSPRKTSDMTDRRTTTEPILDSDCAAQSAASNLAAIGQIATVHNHDLPWNLSYPTKLMRNHLLLFRNALETKRLESEAELEEAYGNQEADLDERVEELRMTLAQARGHAKEAEREVRRREEEKRRRHEEAERKKRERAAEKRRLQEEKERLLRQQEQETREALKGKDLRSCGNCGFGPFERYNCTDMAAHNDKIYVLDKRGRRRKRGKNECPECGWFQKEWNQWPKFNP